MSALATRGPVVYLGGADLRGADLSGANLRGADLREAVLIRADLSWANLSGAVGIMSGKLEQEAHSLEGTTMPDGSKHL